MGIEHKFNFIPVLQHLVQNFDSTGSIEVRRKCQLHGAFVEKITSKQQLLLGTVNDNVISCMQTLSEIEQLQRQIAQMQSHSIIESQSWKREHIIIFQVIDHNAVVSDQITKSLRLFRCRIK